MDQKKPKNPNRSNSIGFSKQEPKKASGMKPPVKPKEKKGGA